MAEPWHKRCEIEELDEGKLLKADERGCLSTLISMMALRRGLVRDNTVDLAAAMNVSRQRWAAIRRKLFKLQIVAIVCTGDGSFLDLGPARPIQRRMLRELPARGGPRTGRFEDAG